MQTPNKTKTQQKIILQKGRAAIKRLHVAACVRDYSRAESINSYDASRLTTNPIHIYVIFHLATVGPVNN